MFAKLYGVDEDQVLVMLDANNSGCPEIKVFFKPHGWGVCSCSVKWEDNAEETWDRAESAFAQIDEYKARGMVEAACGHVNRNVPSNTTAV